MTLTANSPLMQQRLALYRAVLKRRHAARWNIVFCDIPVESLRTKELFGVRKNEVLKRWNKDNLPHRQTLPPLPP